MATEKQKAFTLLELLIVISIIALLMAILMPALGTARLQAFSIVCRSNLSQLVLANIGYATENDGYLVPAASDFLDNAGYHRWHGYRDNLDEPFDPLRGPLVRYLGDGKVKECPGPVEFVKAHKWEISFEQGCGGYGYNMLYLGSRLWQKGFGSGDPKSYSMTTPLAKIAKPSATLMFADTAFYQNNKYLIEYSFIEPRYRVRNGTVKTNSFPVPSIHFRHKQCANVGWADRHVTPEKIADYHTGHEFYTDSAKMNLGWFDPIDNSPFDLQ